MPFDSFPHLQKIAIKYYSSNAHPHYSHISHIYLNKFNNHTSLYAIKSLVFSLFISANAISKYDTGIPFCIAACPFPKERRLFKTKEPTPNWNESELRKQSPEPQKQSLVLKKWKQKISVSKRSYLNYAHRYTKKGPNMQNTLEVPN